jgi:hypothetical protein
MYGWGSGNVDLGQVTTRSSHDPVKSRLGRSGSRTKLCNARPRHLMGSAAARASGGVTRRHVGAQSRVTPLRLCEALNVHKSLMIAQTEVPPFRPRPMAN